VPRPPVRPPLPPDATAGVPSHFVAPRFGELPPRIPKAYPGDPYDVPGDLRQLGGDFLQTLPEGGAWARAVDAEIEARRSSHVPGAARGCLKATVAALGKQLPGNPADAALGPRLTIDLDRAQRGFVRHVEHRLAVRRRGLALAEGMLAMALGGALIDQGIAVWAPATAADAEAGRAYLASAPGLFVVPHDPVPLNDPGTGITARLGELLDHLGVDMYRDYRDEVRPDALPLPLLAGLLAGDREAFASLEGAGAPGA
jgi:hypothetical protein